MEEDIYIDVGRDARFMEECVKNEKGGRENRDKKESDAGCDNAERLS